MRNYGAAVAEGLYKKIVDGIYYEDGRYYIDDVNGKRERDIYIGDVMDWVDNNVTVYRKDGFWDIVKYMRRIWDNKTGALRDEEAVMTYIGTLPIVYRLDE